MCKVELLSVVSEAKVGCLSLSWQPPVEKRETLDILVIAAAPVSSSMSSRMMTTAARSHMLKLCLWGLKRH